jgi:hypothetical protein
MSLYRWQAGVNGVQREGIRFSREKAHVNAPRDRRNEITRVTRCIDPDARERARGREGGRESGEIGKKASAWAGKRRHGAISIIFMRVCSSSLALATSGFFFFHPPLPRAHSPVKCEIANGDYCLFFMR